MSSADVSPPQKVPLELTVCYVTSEVKNQVILKNYKNNLLHTAFKNVTGFLLYQSKNGILRSHLGDWISEAERQAHYAQALKEMKE